ncbi:transposase [Chitinophaga sp. W3I9]|uniref:transposase n=1 Tax=unclassified Chitinophaga TaxID=2619133 RepID=UPI003D200E59
MLSLDGRVIAHQNQLLIHVPKEETLIQFLLSFRTVARTIRTHYLGILNFFNKRATNAAAESFNAKIKSFRNALRGVRDVEFFLYRLTKLYA